LPPAWCQPGIGLPAIGAWELRQCDTVGRLVAAALAGRGLGPRTCRARSARGLWRQRGGDEYVTMPHTLPGIPEI
jgi:hypothetical protein